MTRIMCAQAAPVEERIPSRQENFHGSHFSVNGDGVDLFSGEDQASGELKAALEALFTGAVEARGGHEQETRLPIVLEGALVVSARFGEFKALMMARAERSADGEVTVSFHDHDETLLLRTVDDTGTLDIRTQYTDKPLGAAITSARFFEALTTTPGLLSFEVMEVVGENEAVPHRIEIADLPFRVPEPQLAEYRNRLRLLEGLRDIWINTGVEIRYPADTDDEEGLRNFNFVQRAVRSGWVALSVESFDANLPIAQGPVLLGELRAQGQVGRAFYFELPNESYTVFGTEVNLGPSGRYMAAARLVTSREDIEAQLRTKGGDEGKLDLAWEPEGDLPMHVFYYQWPSSSADSVEQDLREYEAVYGVSSERFRQAWEYGESWAQAIPDGGRWFSLIQAHDEPLEGS